VIERTQNQPAAPASNSVSAPYPGKTRLAQRRRSHSSSAHAPNDVRFGDKAVVPTLHRDSCGSQERDLLRRPLETKV